MSLTQSSRFECPYCMAYNDLDIDEANDVGQQQILDCQICCQPIELQIAETENGLEILARCEDD